MNCSKKQKKKVSCTVLWLALWVIFIVIVVSYITAFNVHTCQFCRLFLLCFKVTLNILFAVFSKVETSYLNILFAVCRSNSV